LPDRPVRAPRPALCLPLLIAASFASTPILPTTSGCAPSDSAPPFCLSGTIVSDDATIAIVKEAGHRLDQGRQIGQSFLDWRIVAIRPRAIEVQQGERVITLDMMAVEPPADDAAPLAANSRPPKPIPTAVDLTRPHVEIRDPGGRLQSRE
jgi:hypothetical protein